MAISWYCQKCEGVSINPIRGGKGPFQRDFNVSMPFLLSVPNLDI